MKENGYELFLKNIQELENCSENEAVKRNNEFISSLKKSLDKFFLKNIQKSENCSENKALEKSNEFISILKKTLEKPEVNEITFQGFGKFYFHKTKPRVRKIPNGRLIMSESREILKFKVSNKMMLEINQIRNRRREEKYEKN
ncbi:MAG: HU family DNA-binding protein [Fusobacterium necrophorum]|nr:HU family DNA-binding protein [Fusobacterium necrophorum]